MANFYLDASAVGNEYQSYTDTPATWGIPQDGNGKAPAASSAAVAIASIDCASASASGAGSLLLFGVTVSSTLTGSGATLATNIANAINASTTAVSATYCQALLPLNKLVYARVNPGVNTQVQVMQRIAGADWNGMNCSSGGTWGTVPTFTAFSGGVDGPFGYFFNTSGAAFGKTGGTNAALNWGIAPSKSPGTTEPGDADLIYVRTRRSGADIALTHATNTGSYNLSPAAGGHRHYVFDDGTTWAGDNGTLSLTVTSASGSNMVCAWNGNVSLIGRAKYGFKMTMGNTVVSTANIVWRPNGGSNNNLLLENVWLAEDFGVSNLAGFAFDTAGLSGSSNLVFKGARFAYKGSGKQIVAGTTMPVHYLFDNSLFEYGSVTSGIINMANAGNYEHLIEFINCTFKDRNDVTSPILSSPITGTVWPANGRLLMDCCKGVAPFTSGLAAASSRLNATITYKMPGTDGDWRVETGAWVSEWRAGANIPYLNGLLPSGAPYAIKTLLRDTAEPRLQLMPVCLNALYRDTTAAKTITVEMLVPTGVSFKKGNLGLLVSYTKDDGTQGMEDTFESWRTVLDGSTATVATSTAAWNMNGTSGYDKVKLTLTTASPILSGTKVSVRVAYRGRLPGNVDRTVFIDPEPQFS